MAEKIVADYGSKILGMQGMTIPAFTNSSGIGPLPSFLEAASDLHLVARVFQSEGLPLSIASSGMNWLPIRSLMGLYERAAAAVGDDFFGLHVGRAMRPEDFGLWARYATSASSLRDMISRTNRSLRFHQSGGELGLDVFDNVAIWRYRVADSTVSGRRHHAEHAIWPMLVALRRYTPSNWKPIRIECGYDRPRLWRKLEEEFGAPLIFDKPANAIVFERRLLDNTIAARKIAVADEITFGDLRRMATQRPPVTVLDAAREILRTRLTEQLADMDGTALLLGMSRRTLQRRLSDENFTFRELLEQLRMERALELLKESSASITEIAFALGYDDATSFSRAFRRHTGRPPSHVTRPR